MPASPSENRTRWRKRKRESQINRRHQKHDDDEEEEEENPNADEDRDYDSEEQTHHNPNNHTNSQQHPEIEVLSDHAVQISQFPLVIKRSVNRPHSSVTSIVALERALESGDNKAQLHNPPFLENVSHGQLQALSTVPSDSAAFDQDRSDSSYVITPPPILEGRGVVKRFGNKTLVVPMHSDWFSPATVHRLERQAVPHFFSGKSQDHTPEKYMECRNYIVALHMEDPGKRIMVSDCQGLVAGVDVEDLTRIVRFLDHWGIINYCVRIPSNEPPNPVSCLREEPGGEVRLPSEALKSIDSLIKFDKPNCKLKADEIYSSLAAQNANVSDLEDRIREHLSENHCNYCSRPLPVVYYQSQKEVDILLCTDCFHDGRFVVGHSSIDFMRVDSTRDYGELDGDNWTDQETLLLLEAMEIYNENWNEIAEYVGTKSKAQCILHFLRLPMEDGKLENINVPSMSSSSSVMNRDDSGRLHCYSNGDTAGPFHQIRDSNSRLPFANSGNPVMALVAFLASAVGPRVAASCAHAALAVLSEDNSGSTSQMEAPGHDNRTNPETIHCRDGGPRGETATSNNHIEDKAKVIGSWGQNEGRTTPLSAEKVEDAAKAGLSAAAMKAKLFADHEEREIQRLCANIVNHQLKRLELKLKQFAEIETLLMKECEQMERTKQRFAGERSRIISARLGNTGATPSMNASGVGPSMASNGNNRQQMISASSSQPSISGYGNNQPVHPHMSFAPRPSMFGLGQRLPLSMIQQSQSASSSAMFNAPSNVQSTTNHPLLRPVSGTNSGLG
ncbi:SWI/SNF complex subunit SWI3C isoform X2 [Abrus precatorius]|uniref:SWI/SNF complex subunit SWI3C isoform X2 n=1 Tax=Abrus precatorius TaxID=3816 RepID=A0A8B8M209_ABRPR|nr:SWI/SNF complex subunit SWI3C isoform X2 [Abrus precatorius]